MEIGGGAVTGAAGGNVEVWVQKRGRHSQFYKPPLGGSRVQGLSMASRGLQINYNHLPAV